MTSELIQQFCLRHIDKSLQYSSNPGRTFTGDRSLRRNEPSYGVFKYRQDTVEQAITANHQFALLDIYALDIQSWSTFKVCTVYGVCIRECSC
jgi:hypothetical protein